MAAWSWRRIADVTERAVRHAFVRGVIAGIAAAFPLAVTAAWIAARVAPSADPGIAWSALAGVGLLFGAIPAALTFGGIARLAARGRRAGAIAASAMAGAGLVLLIALPAGTLPEDSTAWPWTLAVGVAAGLAAGVVVTRLAPPAPDTDAHPPDADTA